MKMRSWETSLTLIKLIQKKQVQIQHVNMNYCFNPSVTLTLDKPLIRVHTVFQMGRGYPFSLDKISSLVERWDINNTVNPSHLVTTGILTVMASF